MYNNSIDFFKFKEPFLEVFIKEGITCKTRPEQEFIRQCSFTVKLVSLDEFKLKLLPPILKSMLRNPEVILECIATVISSVSLDLSAYSLELAKGFSGIKYLFLIQKLPIFLIFII